MELNLIWIALMLKSYYTYSKREYSFVQFMQLNRFYCIYSPKFRDPQLFLEQMCF